MLQRMAELRAGKRNRRVPVAAGVKNRTEAERPAQESEPPAVVGCVGRASRAA